jgi:bifunctional UDP-N-acetylglucosamine pyrophosphorylase/glucosamine-1-phosphate N-acetyltransferase
MDSICCIVLAAGMGKRMGGELPKALVETREKALIDHCLDSIAPLDPKKIVVVAGHKRELLAAHLSQHSLAQRLEIAIQDEQLGTGHAVKCALGSLTGFIGTVVITYADHPLFRPETLSLFVKYHRSKNATLSLISFIAPPPNGYGKIIRKGPDSAVVRITEAKDCSIEELLLTEVNSGIYAVDSAFLKPSVEALTNENAQNEYYLTDIVEKAAKEGQAIAAFLLPDAKEAGGVNTLADLRAVNRILEQRHVNALLLDGVSIADPETLYLDSSVTVEGGARLGPNVQLRGSTVIKRGASLEGTNLVIDSVISDGANIKLGSRVEGATVGSSSSVGPFAHLRPGTVLARECRIGNFVETKNAHFADGAKASHLTYMGDCSVGTDTNIGAGTITCNYDGYKKSQTTIGKGVFIGSNSSLVAPVSIGDGALVAAGSIITREVPAGSLGIARAKQETKEGWATSRRELLTRRSEKKGGG